MVRAIRPFILSPSIQGALIFAMSGGAFAVGNLLAASAMPRADYAHFALMIAILVITSNISPIGLDQILQRREVRAGRRYMMPVLLSASLIGVSAAVAAHMLYGVSSAAVVSLISATIFLALARTATGALRRHGRAITATFIDTAGDWTILAIGATAWFGWFRDEGTASLIFAAVSGVTMIVALTMLASLDRGLRRSRRPVPIGEAIPLLGIIAAGAMLLQAERLLIPLLLSIQELATFAVLTAVAIAPFRVLSAGILTSLTQQLRRLDSREAQRRELGRECRLFAVLALLATLVVCLVAPLAADIFTDGRYAVGLPLCLAACVNGVVKIMQAVPRAVATGIGSAADLHRVNGSMWLCVLGSAVGAMAGAQWGLPILVLGAAIGSGLATLPAIVFVRRRLAHEAAEPLASVARA